MQPFQKTSSNASRYQSFNEANRSTSLQYQSHGNWILLDHHSEYNMMMERVVFTTLEGGSLPYYRNSPKNQPTCVIIVLLQCKTFFCCHENSKAWQPRRAVRRYSPSLQCICIPSVRTYHNISYSSSSSLLDDFVTIKNKLCTWIPITLFE